MSKDNSNDSTGSIPWRERAERANRILDSLLKPKDPKPDLLSGWKPPAPLKPGWVPYQTKDNIDPNLTTKLTKLTNWIGQCMVPANIVAYCKETFGQDVKLTIDQPCEMPLVVTGPPNKFGHIPGINMVEPFHSTMYARYPRAR